MSPWTPTARYRDLINLSINDPCYLAWDESIFNKKRRRRSGIGQRCPEKGYNFQ